MIYYAETNLIAIAVAVVLLFVEQRSSFKHETPQIVMNYMLSLLILMSVSDIAAYYFRGKSFWGAEVANIVYLETMALGVYAWFVFLLIKLGYATDLKRVLIRTGIPMALLCLALAFNPLTGFFFTIDAENLYHRGTGVVVTWVVEWGYMLYAVALGVRAAHREESPNRRREFYGYLLFIVPMAVAAIAQMMVYGITSTQIGFMVAALLMYLNRQYYQVNRDALTGLSNRNAFMNFQDSEVSRRSEEKITLFMVDMDDFKRINDSYGHMAGDNALRDAADILKAAASAASSRLLLFRYGGDEFLIVGRDISEQDIALFEEMLSNQLAKKNEENQQRGRKYTLAMSVGLATGECAQVSDFNALLRRADAAMYSVKREVKAQPAVAD